VCYSHTVQWPFLRIVEHCSQVPEYLALEVEQRGLEVYEPGLDAKPHVGGPGLDGRDVGGKPGSGRDLGGSGGSGKGVEEQQDECWVGILGEVDNC